jgi:hypothetical protein
MKRVTTTRTCVIFLVVLFCLLFLLWTAVADNPAVGLLMAILPLAINIPIGYLLGRSKGRQCDGIIWSVLLGPIGWIITLCLSDGTPRPRCPECLSWVHPGASRCCHCGTQIV